MKFCARYIILPVALFLTGMLFMVSPAFADAISIKNGWIALDVKNNPILQGTQHLVSSKPVKAITNGYETVKVTDNAVIYLDNTKPGTAKALIIGDNILAGYKDAFITTFTVVDNVTPTPSQTPNSNTNSNTNTNANTNTNTNINTNKPTNANNTAPAPASKKYTITYKLNGGTNAKSNPSSYTSGKLVKLANPLRIGYVFKGWYADATFSKKVTSITAKDTGKKILYAKWSVRSYENTSASNGREANIKMLPPDTRTIPLAALPLLEPAI